MVMQSHVFLLFLQAKHSYSDPKGVLYPRTFIPSWYAVFNKLYFKSIKNWIKNVELIAVARVLVLLQEIYNYSLTFP